MTDLRNMPHYLAFTRKQRADKRDAAMVNDWQARFNAARNAACKGGSFAYVAQA